MKIDLDKIVKGDDSLSAREIWGAEYQENVCVLVKKEDVELLQQICQRERIYCMVIGRVTRKNRCVKSFVEENRIEVESNGEEVVNLPVDLTYTQIPQHVYRDSLPVMSEGKSTGEASQDNAEINDSLSGHQIVIPNEGQIVSTSNSTQQTTSSLSLPSFVPPSYTLSSLIDRTLHLLSVGSKSFFVNKFDRSISGLIASQPVLGSLPFIIRAVVLFSCQ